MAKYKSIIIRQIGETSSDGTFILEMDNDFLYKGMDVKFNTGFTARVTKGIGRPYLIYEFISTGLSKMFDPKKEKSCVGFFMAYGTKSRKEKS